MSIKIRMQGVYWILNKANGKVYVGSTFDFPRRITEHRSELRRGTHFNSYLKRAVRKYGLDSFEFEMIEQVDNRLWLPVRETVWIRKLQSHLEEFGYNQLDHGFRSCNQTGAVRSAESRKKMSDAWVARKARGDYYKFTAADHQAANESLSDKWKTDVAWAAEQHQRLLVASARCWADPLWVEAQKGKYRQGWAARKQEGDRING